MFSTSPGTSPTKAYLLSPLNTHQSHTNHIVHNLSNVCTNYTRFQTTEDKNPNHAIYGLHFRHTCHLETRSFHQTCYELVEPKQGYNNAQFEKPHLNSASEKVNDKVFCQIRKHVNYFVKVKNSIYS